MRPFTFLIALLIATAVSIAAPGPGNAVPEPRPKPVLEAALHRATSFAPPPTVATGLPVPRWVTIKAERVNVRRGPSRDQDVLWTYVKPGTPIEIIEEYGSWRKIRDADGSKGWVTAALLDGRRNVVVTGRVNTALLARPTVEAEAVAYAQPGLVAKLVSCAGEWCEVSTRGYSGFVARDRLWGVHASETVR